MLQKVYLMHWYIKIMEKFGSTNKPTFIQLEDAPKTKSALYGMTTMPFDIYNVQLHPYQVRYFDGVVFEPNGIQLHSENYPEGS